MSQQHKSPLSEPENTWQQDLRNAIRSPQDLCRQLGLPTPAVTPLNTHFPTLVTQSFAARMRPCDPNDPLLLQALPRSEESQSIEGFVTDPVGDALVSPQRGVLHKYHGRILLIATGACAIHCRYCFRQHYPYAEQQLSRRVFDELDAYLSEHPSIEEVILSGGDPLLLSTEKLAALSERLQAHPNVKTLRLHTRLPLVLPSRIDEAFCQWLNQLPMKVVLVVHSNHANEWHSEDVTQAFQRLRQLGMHLLNQSVLLRGINDSMESLKALSLAMFEHGVLPYYLHQLDRVRGAHHFEVSEKQAIELLHALREQVPGYLAPRLVREESGKAAKTLLL